jgi:predicted dehydrogenase
VSSAPLAVGVAGVGSLGYHHARHYRALPDAHLAGVYDPRAERAREVAAELGTRAFASLEEMLREVEALSIVVPTPHHHDVAMAAIRAGRHVLVEKPLAATIPQAEAIVAAARSAKVVLQTGHIERFNRAVRAAAPHVDSPRYIQSDRVAPFVVRGSDVAVTLDLMIHDLDLVLSLVREPVTDVRASGIGVLSKSVDIATARIEFKSGAVANLTASRMARDRVRKLRIFQPTGYLSLDLAAGTGEFLRLRRDAVLKIMLSGGKPDLNAVVEEVALEAPEGDALQLELSAFLRAVRGDEEPAVSGEAGLEALKLAFRVMDAMGLKDGQPA